MTILQQVRQITALKSYLTKFITVTSVRSVKEKWQSNGPVSHSKVNESPLPIKIGLLISATTRKKSLVNKVT